MSRVASLAIIAFVHNTSRRCRSSVTLVVWSLLLGSTGSLLSARELLLLLHLQLLLQCVHFWYFCRWKGTVKR